MSSSERQAAIALTRELREVLRVPRQARSVSIQLFDDGQWPRVYMTMPTVNEWTRIGQNFELTARKRKPDPNPQT